MVATITPTTFDITEGIQLSITCDVSGDPSPVVTWQHTRPDGQVVPGKSILLLDRLTSNNESHAKKNIIVKIAVLG